MHLFVSFQSIIYSISQGCCNYSLKFYTQLWGLVVGHKYPQRSLIMNHHLFYESYSNFFYFSICSQLVYSLLCFCLTPVSIFFATLHMALLHSYILHHFILPCEVSYFRWLLNYIFCLRQSSLQLFLICSYGFESKDNELIIKSILILQSMKKLIKIKRYSMKGFNYKRSFFAGIKTSMGCFHKIFFFWTTFFAPILLISLCISPFIIPTWES